MVWIPQDRQGWNCPFYAWPRALSLSCVCVCFRGGIDFTHSPREGAGVGTQRENAVHHCQAHKELSLPERPQRNCWDNQCLLSWSSSETKWLPMKCSWSCWRSNPSGYGDRRGKRKIWATHPCAETVLPVEEESNFLPAWVCLCTGIAMLSASEPRQCQRQENLSNSSAGSFRLPRAASGPPPPRPRLKESGPALGERQSPQEQHVKRCKPLGTSMSCREVITSVDVFLFSEASPWCLLILWRWAALGDSGPHYTSSSEFPLKFTGLVTRSRAVFWPSLGI